MKWLLRRIIKSSLYRWFLVHVLPYIRFSMYYTKIKGHQYQHAYNLLEPGDIILSVDRRKLTTMLIPGTMSHAALCISKQNEMKAPFYEVAEMTHSNYTKSFFFDICKEADRVVILRCLDWDNEYVKRVIGKCLSFERAKYDIEFGLGVESLYCSELVYQADYERRLKVDLSDLAGLGQPYLSPDGLACAHNVVCVWDTDLDWIGLTGKMIENILT